MQVDALASDTVDHLVTAELLHGVALGGGGVRVLDEDGLAHGLALGGVSGRLVTALRAPCSKTTPLSYQQLIGSSFY